MLDQALKCETTPRGGPEAERVLALRRKLPWQRTAVTTGEARLRYRTVSYKQLEREIRRTLPWKLFSRRYVHCWEVQNYPRFIPDEVLLKWDEAGRSTPFDTFWILEPGYGKQPESRSHDPWLIGKISGHYHYIFKDEDQVSVLAFWE